MQNKGQIALFIILGFVILVGFSYVVYLKVQNTSNLKVDSEKIINQPTDTLSIKTFIDSCLESTSEDSLNFIYNHGGYYRLPEQSMFVFFIEQIPYFYFDGKRAVPSYDVVENQLSEFIKANIGTCLKNFSTFKDIGYIIEFGEKEIKTKIGKNTLSISLNFPITIIKDNAKTQLDTFKINLNSNLKEILEISNKLVDIYNEKPGFICISCLEEIDINREILDVTLTTVFDEIFPGDSDGGRNDVVFAIITEKYKPDKDLTFKFIMDYKLEESQKNRVLLEEVENLTAIIGYNFVYEFKALGENLTFSDNTELFEMDKKTGIMNFTPEIDQIGTYLIEISVNDNFGNKDFKIIKLEIKGFVDPPLIDYLGFLDAEANERFFYDVNATDPNGLSIFFADDTDLFNISLKEGTIDFIPTENQIGEYNITIKAINEIGGSDMREMFLRIKK